MIRPRSVIALSVALMILGACGDVRESLGLGRSPPDDFGLRPPRPGTPRPQELDMSRRASDVLFNDENVDAPGGNPIPDAPSDAEKNLLEQSGAGRADPQIRTVIDRESAQKVVESPHLVDQLLWWKKNGDTSTVVDAPAEAARLKEAKDNGKPANQGATPVIEHEKSGWLGL